MAKLKKRWIRSRTGVAAYVVTTTKRRKDGSRLLRLRFIESGVAGRRLWTKEELDAQGVRWLKNKPRRRPK